MRAIIFSLVVLLAFIFDYSSKTYAEAPQTTSSITLDSMITKQITKPSEQTRNINEALIIGQHSLRDGEIRILVCCPTDTTKFVILITNNTELAKKAKPKTLVSFRGYYRGTIKTKIKGKTIIIYAFYAYGFYQVESLKNYKLPNSYYKNNFFNELDLENTLNPPFHNGTIKK